MEKQSRLRPGKLFSWWAIPGFALVLLAIEILGLIHLLAFSVEIAKWARDLVAAHPIVMLIAGFLWLAVLICWPSIERMLPNLPKTTHEHIHEIRTESLPKINAAIDSIEKRLAVEESASTKHEGFNAAIQEQLNALGKKAGDVSSRLEKALELLPAYFSRQDDFTELKSLLGDIVIDYLFICTTYANSLPAARPFSSWRPALPTSTADPAIAAGERFAQRLENYVEIAQSRALAWGRDVFSGDLFSLVPSWRKRSDDRVSGQGLLAMLQHHRQELRSGESDYAAVWSKAVREQ